MKFYKIIVKIFGILRNTLYLYYVIKMINMSSTATPLINRMSTDRINQMLAFSHQYKNSGQYLIDKLMVTDSWLNLEYDVICILNDVFKCGYTPSEIAPLFR